MRVECDKCDGTGYVEDYFTDNRFLCFKCNGSGRIGYIPDNQRSNSLNEND